MLSVNVVLNTTSIYEMNCYSHNIQHFYFFKELGLKNRILAKQRIFELNFAEFVFR